MYAIIETGGKQYRVTPGQVLDVDYLNVAEGKPVEFDKVLLIGDGANVTVGTPTIEGAKVIATFQKEGKGKKIIIFRYKAKARSKRKTGHRQMYTRLAIDKIEAAGAPAEPVKKAVRRRKKEVSESGT